MKRPKVSRVLLAVVIFALLLLGSVSAGAQPSFVGSWVNQTNTSNYKYVYATDGKVDGYATEGTESPWNATYSVENQVSNPDGSITYYLKENWNGVTWYVLWKVAKDGKTAEHSASPQDYLPFDQVPLGTGFHCIYALK